MTETRGKRNNNPFNIRISHGNNWIGKVPVDKNTDGVFEQFDSLEHGVRAGIVLLRRYVKRYHLTSVNDILKRFAPESENDLNSYIRYVKAEYSYLDDTLYTPDNITYPSFSFDLMCSRILQFESKYFITAYDLSLLRIKFGL